MTFAEFIAQARDMGVTDDTKVVVWGDADDNWGYCLPDLEHCPAAECLVAWPKRGTGANLEANTLPSPPSTPACTSPAKGKDEGS